ncbi:MAG: carbamoyl-phosphate synthase small subunit [Alphaproteobacteria bacterium]|nr:carbamoyl-phosphate synthase small subunit [Alphaproteobacteria bacterium]
MRCQGLPQSASPLPPPPPTATAALVLADGSVFWGEGFGATGQAIGELCFNTAITGYQEILTDPSYAGQIIAFTFPHIGNVGVNPEDIEATTPAARGLVLRTTPTEPANFRSRDRLQPWLAGRGLVGIGGVDTRRLTRHIRTKGFQNAAIGHDPSGRLDARALHAAARDCPGLEGRDLAQHVTCRQTYTWDETRWTLGQGYGRMEHPRRHVVAIDYGVKRNILRSLASLGCRVTVVPATASVADVMRHRPDGIFLSNGPGDPAATGTYAVPTIAGLLATPTPLFGICLGHQMLALALGARTRKMACGHRGANHPVRDLATGKVEITSQNHGFVVDPDSLPAGVVATHVSLFDQSLEGLRVDGRPVFSVQYHPEASPGPRDSAYLFERFIQAIDARA